MRIAVEETGQGISPEFLPHVFERFRQADPSTTRGAWGLGIGLSIAKHLVELHGGDIVAASGGIGLGSMFVVRLPLNAGNERARTSLNRAACRRRRPRFRARGRRVARRVTRRSPPDTLSPVR